MKIQLFRFSSTIVASFFFILALVAHITLGSLLILYTLLAFSAFCIWFPWPIIGRWCIDLSLQESHTLWKAVADSIKRQDSYFRVNGACMGCGSFIYEGAHYCIHCGLPTSLVYAGRWCMRCSSINPVSAKFCACCCYEFPPQESDPITPPIFKSAPLAIKTGKYSTVSK